ncbi:MAG: hypothetical protein KBD83_07465 [Gammaproteobacteria bacterium]|nr:hypothetical protein [Gammaproteobacteria bacterium]
MAITSISTDWGTSPRCVRMTTTDNLSVITTAGYFATQEDEIQSINAGAWTWVAGDFIDIVYGDGQGYFTYNSTTDAFVAAPPSGGLSSTLASGRIFVGNVSNVATGVVMSGDTTVDNTGAVAIGADKVLSSMVSPLVRKYAAVTITAAQFNGMYAAPKLLVAAGGANTLIVLDQLQLAMTYVSANYAAGGVAAVQYDSTANGAGVIASTTLSAATFQAAASSTFTMNSGVVVLPFTTTVNKGLYLSNITGAFTTGDSTFVAHVWYRVIPTT